MNNEQIIKATEELIGKFSGPAKQLNALVVSHIEQLSRFQLKTVEAYADLGIDQLKASLQVSDIKALQDFVKNQGKVAETVTHKITVDSEALVRLNTEFAAAVQKLAQESTKGLTPVKSTPRKTAA